MSTDWAVDYGRIIPLFGSSQGKSVRLEYRTASLAR